MEVSAYFFFFRFFSCPLPHIKATISSIRVRWLVRRNQNDGRDGPVVVSNFHLAFGCATQAKGQLIPTWCGLQGPPNRREMRKGEKRRALHEHNQRRERTKPPFRSEEQSPYLPGSKMARPGIMERDWASPSPWCVPEEGNFNIVFARAVQARTHGKKSC